MNSINNYGLPKYKQCAGRNCNKKGTNLLQILFIKKIGYFCDSCTTQLLELGLVTKEEKLT